MLKIPTLNVRGPDQRLGNAARFPLLLLNRAFLFSFMSRAFVKEDVDPPERSGRKRSASGLPPGATNYITARGAKRLRDELQKLRASGADSERVSELENILASVLIVDPPDPASNS